MSDASHPSPVDPSDALSWRQDELVARILRRWRELTGGKRTRDDDRKTLIACSGGVDSMALAFATAQIPGASVIAHVRHDIRSDSDVMADSEFVRGYAATWGATYDEAAIKVQALSGNLEANAREHRYAALVRLAKENKCQYIATGHHADDQLETLLMSLLRGSGTRAMGGMRPCRELHGCTLIRPMLKVSRSENQALLDRAGVTWREDHTNTDTRFERNRIRHELIPMLNAIEPQIAKKSSNWAADLQGLHALAFEQTHLLGMAAERSADGTLAWTRDQLIEVPDVIIGILPHWMFEQVSRFTGQDLITRRAIAAWIRSMKSENTNPTEHRMGPIVSRISAHQVTMRFLDDPQCSDS